MSRALLDTFFGILFIGFDAAELAALLAPQLLPKGFVAATLRERDQHAALFWVMQIAYAGVGGLMLALGAAAF